MGRPTYPRATRLLITADAGGSNGSRLRLWKLELQKLADETGLRIVVCHFPPGTSKWNRIEHRLFSYISQQGGKSATGLIFPSVYYRRAFGDSATYFRPGRYSFLRTDESPLIRRFSFSYITRLI
jgi:hypothetical protein